MCWTRWAATSSRSATARPTPSTQPEMWQPYDFNGRLPALVRNPARFSTRARRHDLQDRRRACRPRPIVFDEEHGGQPLDLNERPAQARPGRGTSATWHARLLRDEQIVAHPRPVPAACASPPTGPSSSTTGADHRADLHPRLRRPGDLPDPLHHRAGLRRRAARDHDRARAEEHAGAAAGDRARTSTSS